MKRTYRREVTKEVGNHFGWKTRESDHGTFNRNKKVEEMEVMYVRVIVQNDSKIGFIKDFGLKRRTDMIMKDLGMRVMGVVLMPED